MIQELQSQTVPEPQDAGSLVQVAGFFRAQLHVSKPWQFNEPKVTALQSRLLDHYKLGGVLGEGSIFRCKVPSCLRCLSCWGRSRPSLRLLQSAGLCVARACACACAYLRGCVCVCVCVCVGVCVDGR